MSDLKYLRGYPEPLLAQVRQLIADNRLGEYLERRYPGRHQVQSDKALYGYVQQLKQEYLKSAPPIDKVLYDNRLDLTHRALGLHTAVSRVQGGKLKAKKEIRVAALFREAAPEFLRMIVVHEPPICAKVSTTAPSTSCANTCCRATGRSSSTCGCSCTGASCGPRMPNPAATPDAQWRQACGCMPAALRSSPASATRSSRTTTWSNNRSASPARRPWRTAGR